MSSRAAFERWLNREWRKKGPAQILLLPLSWLFGALAMVRRACYRAGVCRVHAVGAPVVIVGSIAVGGVGKTPIVLALAKLLQGAGFRPGIVTRGYKGETRGPREVSAEDDPILVGDEALLLARNGGCPVWLGADRVAAARGLVAAHADTDIVLSDDGLQHYRLARAIEIAVVDGRYGCGNKRLLPAGPLREPIRRLHSVDYVLKNGVTTAEYSVEIVGECFYNVSNPFRTTTAEAFRDRSVVAIAGIANPQRFFDRLRMLKIRFRSYAFPDHWGFVREDLEFAEADAIIMTEKDAVKCADFAGEKCWYLKIEARLNEAFKADFLYRVRCLLDRANLPQATAEYIHGP